MNFRERALECLGKLPQKVDIQPEVINSVDKGTHILQTVIASHQHADEIFLCKSESAGLSKNTMYHYGLELCKSLLKYRGWRIVALKRRDTKDLCSVNISLKDPHYRSSTYPTCAGEWIYYNLSTLWIRTE